MPSSNGRAVPPVVFDVEGVSIEVDLDEVVVAGFTGRDRAEVDAHVAELAEHGVTPPATIPAYWRFPAWIVTQGDQVVVSGPSSSGEVELALVVDGDDVWVTVASDHTDRAVEAIDIALSKHVCPKVLGRRAWPLAAVADHLDDLTLRSWITEIAASVDHQDGPADVVYQDGTAATLVDAPDLLAGVPAPRPRSFVLLTGTVPCRGGIRPASRFRAELADPTTGAALTLDYAVRSLDPVPSTARSSP